MSAPTQYDELFATVYDALNQASDCVLDAIRAELPMPVINELDQLCSDLGEAKETAKAARRAIEAS